MKTAKRGSVIAGGQLEGTQQEDKRNIRTGEMNGNNWGGKPAQNKARKKTLPSGRTYVELKEKGR